MNFKKLIEELKRRNVFKVATAYAIAGWLIIQVVTSISEPLSLPDWFDTSVIILVFIGFPIALIIAWAFELTSDGLKKSKEVEITESVTASTGKKLNRVIISVLSLAVIFLLINRVFYAQSNSSTSNSGITSIAVLPFVDMSPNKDQEYFSDGLSEELLNVLAKVKEMKVAGRTSSFKFKGKNDDLKKVGAELGVAHILEGSVRKAGDRIRITAQLIKVDDGFHMWSETYDRSYSAANLFDVQDEISEEVLKELKVKLLDTEEVTENTNIPTKNTKAYEAYLKGNQLLVNRKPKEIEEAIVLFKEAISLDSKFALGYARLAIAYSFLFSYGNIDVKEVPPLIRENADQALLLDNTLGSAYAALSDYYEFKMDFKKAKGASKKAYELEPNNPEIVVWYANSLDQEGNAKLKTELFERALEIDPLAPVVISNMINDLFRNEKYEDAQTLAEKNVELNPDYGGVNMRLVSMLRNFPNGKLDEAFISAYKAYQQNDKDLQILTVLSELALDLDLLFISQEVEEKLKEYFPENPAASNVHFTNYTYQKNLEGIYNEMDALYEKFGMKKESEFRVMAEIQRFDFLKDYKGAVNYIEKYHPIYFSDTLTTAPYKMNVALAHLSVVFLKAGKKEVANRLTKLYTKKIESKFEYDGDISKESIQTLLEYSYSLALKGDTKKVSEILSEVYFNRKFKIRTYSYNDLDIVFKPIQNDPEYIALLAGIEADLQPMRDKAITFLKAEGKWPEKTSR